MKRALAAAVIGVAAASIPGAAAGRGIGLSASPLRVTLKDASAAAITVRNPGRRTLRVEVSRAGFARTLRGRPRVRPGRTATAWLHIRPRRLRLAPGARVTLHLRAAAGRTAEPGDHPALILLTTRPLGFHRVRVRLRVGVMVVLHVAGRIVRRLDVQALSVRRQGAHVLLELLVVNRGNVTERVGDGKLRLVLLRGGRAVATLRPRWQELLPRSRGLVEFAYHGPVRGNVVARIELGRGMHGRARWFRIRL